MVTLYVVTYRFLRKPKRQQKSLENYNLISHLRYIFTITTEIPARSLANFYCQYPDRHINLKFIRASASKSGQFDNLS